MAEMFLILDGVDGESLDEKFHDKIEIEKWDWTTNAHVRWDLNQGGQSSKVEIKEITLTKHCDLASVTLYQFCVTGKHIKNGKIICRKNDGEKKLEYLTVDMEDIMVSEVSWQGNGQDTALDETLKISFAEFKLHYKVQDDSGEEGKHRDFGFHIQRQKHT